MVCAWKWFLVMFLILSLQISLSFSWRRRRTSLPACHCHKKYQPRCKLIFKSSSGKKYSVDDKRCSSLCRHCPYSIRCKHDNTRGAWETWTCQKQRFSIRLVPSGGGKGVFFSTSDCFMVRFINFKLLSGGSVNLLIVQNLSTRHRLELCFCRIMSTYLTHYLSLSKQRVAQPIRTQHF